ncbi:GGDEF domain-containing protein [Butyrivibrio sp. FCS014]|uniref:GGDEF domain-containing protein n=1 Tax=Butyrivibrio sp. FCS014 TaxID=1408304 RepID=UPI000463FE0E|nr:GGDEF domain-containing protein [Butyrivibrio sp. FCS014]
MKIFKNTRFRSIIMSTIIAWAIIILCFICLTFKENYPIYILDDGWTAHINGIKTENVTLSKFYKVKDGRLLRGDTITLTKELPQTEDFDFPVILFRSRYTTLDVYLDDDLIFTFGDNLYDKELFIGKMYHFISLPEDYAGKTLTFNMRVGENNAFQNLAPPRLGGQPDIEGEFLHKNMTIIFTGMFMIVFGVAFLCITIFYFTSVPEIRTFMFSSMFCINIGAWLLTYYNVLSPFIYTEHETFVEYFTLYLIVPYCYLICYCIQNVERKKLFFTAAALSCAVTLIQYLLHFAFNIHLRATLPMYHACCVGGFILLAYYTVKDLRSRDIGPSNSTQMLGLITFSVSEIFHLAFYMLENIHLKYPEMLSILIITFGCLMFAFCQLANYLMYITQSYAQKQEYASLSRLAYEDGLTDLPNRARSDKELLDLDKTDTDYCIISIDLNGLKYVNDKFGHPSGDKYIKDFSKVLTSTFEDQGFCARIGGDEFLVIINDSEGKDISALIGRMESALNVMNALYPEYHRSVATGYAFRHEGKEDTTSHEIYLMADERMYAKKRRMHEELGIRQRL